MPFTLLATAACLPALGQKPQLPFVDPLFSSDMVLQRDNSDPIWGWTTPNAKVTVSIGGKTVQTTSDTTGKWLTKLPKFGPGGSYELKVTGSGDADFTNVTFGDVWICSGQSNMEFGVGNLKNPASEIADGNQPNIRLYKQPKLIAYSPRIGVGGTWEPCTTDNLMKDGDWNGFSAVAYFFGLKLNKDLHIPIGLIHTSWGGTIAEAWTPEEWLHKNLPEFDPALKVVDQERSQREMNPPGSYSSRIADWYAKNDPGSSPTSSWAAPNLNDSDWRTTTAPGFFQKSGFPEFLNNQSVVWYRKVVNIPSVAGIHDAILHFYADDNDVAFVNGIQVGGTDGWNINRAYTIPAGVLHDGENVIAVRVTDTAQPGGIYGDPDTLYLETGDGNKIPLAGDWKIKLGTVINPSSGFPTNNDINPNIPTVLYNGMVSPLAPFAVKGAIWYQGESNVGRAKQYSHLLPTMIESWRSSFQSGDFPFLIVQLAGFQKPADQPIDDGWAELREAQWIASKSVKNGGIATAIDIGDETDIHPKNKEEVGRRLALVAESKFYGKHVEDAGPTFKSVRFAGSSAIISFEHDSGLKTVDGGPVKGFALEGDDHKWAWADAKIEGNKVIVTSSQIAHPIAVRYAWASYQELNLQNRDGLPAFPFRTDTEPLH